MSVQAGKLEIAKRRFANCGELSLFVLRFALGILFFFVGVTHVSNPWKFAVAIENYQLLPVGWAGALAVFIPLLQLTTGVLLFSGTWKRTAFAIAALMFAIFAIAEFSALMRDFSISCGCFGNLSPKVTWLTFGLTCLASVFGLVGYFFETEIDSAFVRGQADVV